MVGIPGIATNFGSAFSLGTRAAGSCAEAVASIEALLPSPLCASAPLQFVPAGRQFVCSGNAGDVMEAVGNASKGLLALPPAPTP